MAEPFADALAPPPPPKLGFAGALSAFFGGNPSGAYTEGLNTGSQYRLRSAQTEESLARAEVERAERMRKQQEIDAINKAQSDPNYRGTFADMLTLGRNPQQYGIDPLSVQEHDLRASTADPNTPWEQLQRNRMALGESAVNRYDSAGTGRGVYDLLGGTYDPKMQPIDEANLASEQALAGQRNRAPAGAADGLGKPPSGYRWTADGQLEFIAGGPQDPNRPKAAPGDKPLTEFQVKTLSQLSRMDRTEQALQSPELAQYVPALADVAMDAVPGVGNYAVSKEYQKYKQMANEWISGLLRLDSGAAVPETEFKRYFTVFFPQPGDGPETAVQKGAARQAATAALRSAVPSIAATIDASRASQAPAAGGTEPMRSTSKSGKPIISRDGGQSWEYE